MPVGTLHKRSARPASGFSALEGIVAIIILGLGFAAVLKGAVVVDTVRAFVAGYKLQQYQARVLMYATTEKYLPGDDPGGPRKWGRPGAVTLLRNAPVSKVGDSKIDGKLSDQLNPTGEQFMAWRDLRYAGILDGDPELAGVSAAPENPFGGIYGFDEGNLGQKFASLCLTRVPGRAAEMIDKRFDDGVIDKGSIVGTSQYDPVDALNHFEEPETQPYDVEKEYIICAPAMP
jgi:hypothetical protein